MNFDSFPRHVWEGRPQSWMTREERRSLLKYELHRYGVPDNEHLRDSQAIFLVTRHKGENLMNAETAIMTRRHGNMAFTGALVVEQMLQREGKDGVLDELVREGKLRRCGKYHDAGRIELEEWFLDQLDNALLLRHPEYGAPDEVAPALDAKRLEQLAEKFPLSDGIEVYRLKKPYTPANGSFSFGVLPVSFLIPADLTARRPEERPEAVDSMLKEKVLERAGVVKWDPADRCWKLDPPNGKKK